MLFIYDISNQYSFYGLESWHELYKDKNEKVIRLLTGNKSDLERKVSIEETKKFAEEHGLKYLGTSTKSDKISGKLFLVF